jgi:arylsulfatase A-like enzyme
MRFVACGAALVLAALPAGAWAWPNGAAEPSAEAAVTRRPSHIVLITVDTLRADAVSAYRSDGDKSRRTASIDGLAQDGVRFDHAFAPAPWTLPSIASILTGVSPEVHQVTDFAGRLPNTVTTLAERLSARGYRTASFVHNDVLGPERSLNQGFAEYHDLHRPWFAESIGASLLQRTMPGLFPPLTWPTTADETGVVVDWLDANRGRDFFLWVHYLDPHAPYQPPTQYIAGTPPPGIGDEFEGQQLVMEGQPVPSVDQRRWIRALYDSEVQYVDASLGRVFTTLKRLGLYDDALIVLTSDHGEEFWEHRSIGHGHTMYQEVLRVPLIVKRPGDGQRGTAAPLVSTVSVTPTILDVAGLPFNAQDMSAPSLAPLLAPGAAAPEPRPLLAGAQMLFDRREAVRFDHYRYIVSTVDGAEELYDLESDPGEQLSIARVSPDLVKTGRELLQKELAAARQLGKRLGIERVTHEMDTETIRRLRTLGYVR